MKTLGLHGTRVALHPEVVVKVQMNVARSGTDEAERQARGEDVTVIKDEEDRTRDLQSRRGVRGRWRAGNRRAARRVMTSSASVPVADERRGTLADAH